MRLGRFFWTSCATILVVGTASATSQLNLTELLGDLPTCALRCVLDKVPSSSCGTTNFTCICNNISLQSDLSVCVQGSCNFTEQTVVAGVNDALCAGTPIASRGWQVITVSLIFGIVTLVTVLLRCYSRYRIAHGFWWDDWGILLAMVLFLTTVILGTFNCMLGYGRHIWNIDPTKVGKLLKVFWASEILYNATLTTTRTSILLFYHRVFKDPSFQKFTVRSIIFVIMSGLASNFVIIFQCKPVSGAWDWAIPRSQCINVNAFAYANAGIGITQDVIILFMPIPHLLSLQMSGMRKFNLILLFSLGALAAITSMVRLRFLVAFGDSVDPTWDNVVPSIWSILEISIAMICTCVPSIRALIYRWFPSLGPTTTRQYQENYRGHTDHSWNVSRDLKLGSHAGNYSSRINSGRDKSVSREASGDDALRSQEEIMSHSPSDIEYRKHGRVISKGSDEIKLFHTSQDAVPLTKLDQKSDRETVCRVC